MMSEQSERVERCPYCDSYLSMGKFTEETDAMYREHLRFEHGMEP
jgi:hypothetical protein